MLPMDLHTHSIASGHGTCHTITELARAARRKRMSVLGVSDHGPATPGSCQESYFRTLKIAPGERCGVRLLYGAEANILDESGRLDLGCETLAGLDYVIASLHSQSFRCGLSSSLPFTDTLPGPPNLQPTPIETYTQAYIHAMENPYVKIIGHPDDVHFPVDAARLVQAAVKHRVVLEVNEASLGPEGYRGNTRDIMRTLLTLCLEYRHPVLISSDSHGSAGIGDTPCCLELLREAGFPRELILNYQPPEVFLSFRS